MNYIIGIDVGTTATKGVLYNELGKAVSTVSKGYPLIQEKIGQAEEDPKLIFDAVQEIIYKLAQQTTGKILAISWSSQMHSLIGLDQNNELLTNSITWADNCAKSIVEDAKNKGLAKKVYRKTGMPMHPMAPIYKLLWLKDQKSELFKQTQKWIGIKEYLIFRLTGKMITDTTMAAGTGMLNLNTLTWDQELLNIVGIKQAQLPEIAQPIEVISPIKIEYVQKLGINPDTKIILGASDGYLSTIGVNAIDSDHFALNIGTSGAVRTIVDQPKIDENASYFCYPIDQQHYLLGGPVNNGGIVFNWARQTLFDANETPQDFLDVAQTAPAGSRNLIFLPYLGGERAPIWNADARGSFIGLTRMHQKPEMARAVIEGIIFNLYDAASNLIKNTKKPVTINATGGFLKSDFVRQLCANVFNVPIVTMKEEQSGTLAAMFLARQALGLSKNMDEIEQFAQFAQTDKVYFPNQKEAAIYQSIFPLYCEIRDALAASYKNFNK
ncbi:gluconokinase [Lactobacillus ultunensis]|uniref:Putative gluconokinase n=1 Tax=Lactobacillus ultunensis DSM 16047 TaxID=525365 RepID=C2ER04_9LACO|nr:gluconokinase [Lactobacillus ultunensis]EEJ70989.1 putative gluconokinase [Lactobacillus ultunensis DSM 16047]KRL81107.1 gluconokinase [Lactobacillus ultunensis DSM 16047]